MDKGNTLKEVPQVVKKVLTKEQEMQNQIDRLNIEKLQLDLQLMENRQVFSLLPSAKDDLGRSLIYVEDALVAVKEGHLLRYLFNLNTSLEAHTQIERMLLQYEFKTFYGTIRMTLTLLQHSITNKLKVIADENEAIALKEKALTTKTKTSKQKGDKPNVK